MEILSHVLVEGLALAGGFAAGFFYRKYIMDAHHESLEALGNEFSKSGLDIPLIPGKEVRPEEYETAFEAFSIHVFGAS